MSTAFDAPTQPVDVAALRLNVAVRDLMTDYGMDLPRATDVCCALESATTWIERFALLVARTPIAADHARKWLLDHAYMGERELLDGGRGAA